MFAIYDIFSVNLNTFHQKLQIFSEWSFISFSKNIGFEKRDWLFFLLRATFQGFQAIKLIQHQRIFAVLFPENFNELLSSILHIYLSGLFSKIIFNFYHKNQKLFMLENLTWFFGPFASLLFILQTFQKQFFLLLSYLCTFS